MTATQVFVMTARLRAQKFHRFWWLGCVMALACAGCGSDSRRGYIEHNEELVSVEGRVLFEGKPATNATIIFHRNEEPSQDPANRSPNPRGECNQNGEFQLYTYANDDGAPIGDYRVSVSWRDPEGTGREDNFPELLPARYLDPKTSGLTAHIPDDGGFLPQFELKR